MRGFSTELKVGIFAIIVMAILTFMTFKVGGLDWMRAKGYVVYVNFDNISGLNEKTHVKIAGVDAGTVDGIELVDGRARIRLRIDNRVKLYKDARASIKSTGLLGDKFLDINIGSPDQPILKSGDTITNVTELVDMDDLARGLTKVSNNFSKLAESLNEVFGTAESKEALNQTIKNLRELTVNLNRTVTVNDQKLRTVLDNINNLAGSISRLVDKNSEPLTNTIANVRDFTSTLKKDGPELVENLNKATRELKALIEENRPAVKSAVETIDNVARQINKGEGTLGKLVKDDRLYESVNKAAEGMNKTFSAIERFRTFITFQAEYLTKEKDGKGYFDVTLQPSPDKYYILGVVGGPRRTVTVTETTTNGVTVKEEEIKEKIRFNAQFARRFGDTAMRIGLMENTFGLGVDYFFNNDRGRITADVWDFSKDEEGAKNAHLKAGMSYYVFKNLFLSAGADNILNKKRRGGYVGMGIRFEDEDFKYLLGTVPKISTK